LADSGLFGLDLSADANAAKNTTLLELYQPSTFLSAEEYTSATENGQALRKVYKMFLVAVSTYNNITANRIGISAYSYTQCVPNCIESIYPFFVL
jgi:hypothetical protein